MIIPMFDQGVALNMVVLLRKAPSAFAKEELPGMVWLTMSAYFSQLATRSFVTSKISSG